MGGEPRVRGKEGGEERRERRREGREITGTELGIFTEISLKRERDKRGGRIGSGMDSFANECMVQSLSENGEFDARTKGGERENEAGSGSGRREAWMGWTGGKHG